MYIQPFNPLEAILLCAVLIAMATLVTIGLNKTSKVLHDKWPGFPILFDGL